MTDNEIFTVERLREILDYDPNSGSLTWKKYISRSQQKNDSALKAINKNGYSVINMNRKTVLAQRVIWALMTGEFPQAFVSFKDKNRQNLKWDNLFEMDMIKGKFDHSTPEGRSIYRKARHSQKPEKSRNNHLINTFGIDLRQYEEIFLNQNGCCAICNKKETAISRGKPLSLAVDHDHASGEIRSLLCQKCNLGLGSFNDDSLLLTSAISYIQHHKSKPLKDSNVIQLNKGAK